MTAKHPAKYSEPLIPVLRACLSDVRRVNGQAVVLDQMGGIGGIHKLRRPDLYTVANEIELDWACQHPSNVCGNALGLPFPSSTFDAWCCSVVYFNRMSDSHNAQDGSKRNTYTHTIGHELHPDNAGKVQWNDKARDFTWLMLAESLRVLRKDARARAILNVSNHIRKGVEQDVTGYHVEVMKWLGMIPTEHYRVKTRRNKQGRNGNIRVSHESVIMFKWDLTDPPGSVRLIP